MSKLNDAVELGLLRKYNLATAQVGDKVLGLDPGKVIAIHCGRVVFGWDKGNVNSCVVEHTHCIYLAPLAWVEDRPVYAGDVLYANWLGADPSGYATVGVVDGGLTVRQVEQSRCSVPDLDVRLDDLTWTKPVTTIKVNGHDVPTPKRVAPPSGTMYWVPLMTASEPCVIYRWANDDFDARSLARGLVHLTEEAAVAHAKALLSFTEVRDV